MLPGSILPQENALDMNRPAVELQSCESSIVQCDRLLHRWHGFTYGSKHIIIPAKTSPGFNLNLSTCKWVNFLFLICTQAFSIWCCERTDWWFIIRRLERFGLGHTCSAAFVLSVLAMQDEAENHQQQQNQTAQRQHHQKPPLLIERRVNLS